METNKRNNERIVFPQVIAPSKYHISRELPLFRSSQVNQGNAHRSWLIGDWLILPSSFRLVSSYSRVQSEGEGTPVVLGISHRSPELGRELGRVVMVSFDPDGIRRNGWSTWRADTPSMFLTCKRNLEDPPRGRSVIRDWRPRLIRRRCAEGGRDPGIDPPEDRTTKLPGNVDVSRSKFRCCGVGIERIGSMKSERWGFREIFPFNFDDGELTGDWFNRND